MDVRRAAIVLLAGLVDCREPTQITIELTTDVKCADLHEATIAVGGLEGLEGGAPSAITSRCDPSSGTIGSLVVTPTATDAPVAVRVVAAFGAKKKASECDASGYKGGCIVARRVVRFVPHTRLRLPIALEAACADVPCGVSETCVGGRCVPATVDCDPVLGCVPQADGGNAPPALVQRSFGGAGDDWIAALTRDPGGDVAIAGMISGAVDLGSGPVNAFSGGAPLVARFGPDLAPRWGYPLAATASSAAYGVAAGGANVYGAGVSLSGNVGSAFLLALDGAKGSFTRTDYWPNARGYAVVADGQAHEWVGASCGFGTATVGGQPCTSGTGFVAAVQDPFVTRWSRLFGGKTSAGAVTSLALSGTHLFVAGNVGEPVDFGGGLVPNVASSDAFVASYDAATGKYEWAKLFGGPGIQVIHSIATDGASIWVVGDMEGTLTAGGTVLTSAGYSDVFVLDLDASNGAPLLARRFGGANDENGRAIALDPSGNAWLCGQFQANGDFGAGPVASKGNIDMFVTSLAPNGAVRLARTFGRSGTSACYGIAATSSAYYLAGTFDGQLDFGGPTLATAGKQDAFLVRLPQ